MQSVLVVDPGELGELLATLFEQYGIAARSVRSAREALEEALADKPSAVVIDIDLPDAPAFDIAGILRKELSLLTIATYTPSRATKDVAFRARLQEFDGVFARPFRSLSLIEEVAGLIGAQPIPPPALPPQEDYIDINFDDDSIDSAPSKGARQSAALDLPGAEEPRGDDAIEDMFQRLRTTPPPPAKTRPAPAKMPPSGDGTLTPRVLADLLDAFHQSGACARLWLTRGKAQRVLRIRHGRVIGARSNVRNESFTSVLAKAIGDDDAATIWTEASDTGISPARAALAYGVAPDTVRQVVKEQIMTVGVGAFSWSKARYRVEPEEQSRELRGAASHRIGELILRGVARSEPIEELRRAVPRDARFAPNPDASYQLGDLCLSADEARMVIAIDGTKTVDDIMAIFDKDERETLGLIAGLFRLGVLSYQGSGHAKPPAIVFF